MLEDRRLLNGVTLITHGWNSDASGWVSEMANAIANELPDPSSTSIWTLGVTDDSYPLGSPQVSTVTCDSGPNRFTENYNGETIIKLDWSAAQGRGTTEVASAIADYLLTTQVSGKTWLDMPLHVIGHSRGASLVGELAADLGEKGVWVDQVTTLDPHPLTDTGLDHVFVPGIVDAPMNAWSNVAFWDNYWEDTLVYPHGESISGTHSVYETYPDGGYPTVEGGSHSDVHLWYHGTIDTSSTAFDGSYSVPPDWYSGAQGPRDQTGFYYSSIVGGVRPDDGVPTSLGGAADRQPVDLTGAVWPDIINLTMDSPDSQVIEGDTFGVTYWYQDYDSSATMTFYLDRDGNPYNGNEIQAGQTSETQTGASLGWDSHTIDTVGVSGGTYHVFAKIADGTHERYAYAPGTMTVLGSDWADYEQYLLELVNRARADPAGEAARYGIDLNEGLAPGTISSDPKQPLALNPSLIDGARGHSQWMIDNDVFSHTGANGSSPGDRMAAAGYDFVPPWSWGENIGWWGTRPGSPSPLSTTAVLHEALFVDSGIDGRGHRVNLMDPDFREIGIGIVLGEFSGYNAEMVTEDFAYTFASDSAGFLTGVAYDDGLVSGDSFYTPGEGFGGVTITALRASDAATFSTTTWSTGGYSLALPAGTYTVTASGGGLPGVVTVQAVQMDSSNVKVDFTSDMVTAVWQNPNHPLDVNPDDYITTQDALILANFLYYHGQQPVPAGPGTPPFPAAPPPYYDVSGDNYVTTQDALLVANFLYYNGQQPVGQGQGASPLPATPPPSSGAGSDDSAAPRVASASLAAPQLQPALDAPAAQVPAVETPGFLFSWQDSCRTDCQSVPHAVAPAGRAKENGSLSLAGKDRATLSMPPGGSSRQRVSSGSLAAAEAFRGYPVAEGPFPVAGRPDLPASVVDRIMEDVRWGYDLLGEK